MGQKGIQSCSPLVFTTVWYHNTSGQGSKLYLTLVRPGLMLNHQLLKEPELKKNTQKEQNLIKNSSFGWFLALALLNLDGWALNH